MTSSNGNIFRVTGPLCGEFTGPGEFPTQRPVMWSFDVFCDLRLNKRLSKQTRGWWFEAQSWSLWRHCNDTMNTCSSPWILMASRAPFQYPIRRLIVKSRQVSKARDRGLNCSYRFEIWQAHRCCRGACQISERSDNSKYKSRGFGTLRDLMVRRLTGYWNRAQVFPVVYG